MGSNLFKNKILSLISVTSLALGIFLSSMGSIPVKAADPTSNFISLGYVSGSTNGTYQGIQNQSYSDVLVSAFNSLSLENDWLLDGEDLDSFLTTNGLKTYLDKYDDYGEPSPDFYVNVSYTLIGSEPNIVLLFCKPFVPGPVDSLVYTYDGQSYLGFETFASSSLRVPIYYACPSDSTSNSLGTKLYVGMFYARNSGLSNPSVAHSSCWNALISSLSSDKSLNSITSNVAYPLSTWLSDDSLLYGGLYVDSSGSFNGVRTQYGSQFYSFPFDYKHCICSFPIFAINNVSHYPVFYGSPFDLNGWFAVVKSNDTAMISSDQDYIYAYTDRFHSITSSPWVTPTPIPSYVPVSPTPFPSYGLTATLTPIPNYVGVDTNIDTSTTISALSSLTSILENFVSSLQIMVLGRFIIDYLFSFSPYFSFIIMIPIIGLIAYAIGRLNQK